MKHWFHQLLILMGIVLVLGGPALPASAASDDLFTEVCPGIPLQTRAPGFQPGGLILTAFDKSGMWLYNINRDSRYPLPETRPCNRHCRLSPDARWITYVDAKTNSYAKMRLDGTQRILLADYIDTDLVNVNYANDVEWWPENRLLIWTPGHKAYWITEADPEPHYLNVQGIVSIQPGGTWGLYLEQLGDGFTRSLLNIETRYLNGIAGGQIMLGPDTPYFNASGWSPNGTQFAYVAPDQFDANASIAGAELFVINPDTAELTKLTDLNSTYGAARINGGIRSELSWSPDSTHIAFWVIELLGPAYENDTGNAQIHIVDTRTGEVRAYCGFATTEHTPDPPRLQWSPDGTHLAFGGNVPGDDKGYLLLTLNIETGVFTSLSEGIFPAVGAADIIAWGLPPG